MVLITKRPLLHVYHTHNKSLRLLDLCGRTTVSRLISGQDSKLRVMAIDTQKNKRLVKTQSKESKEILEVQESRKKIAKETYIKEKPHSDMVRVVSNLKITVFISFFSPMFL